MGATNGFRRLPKDQLAELATNASAFESTCREVDDPNYLDMDKAGYELLFILDPASVEYDNPKASTPFPAIKGLLSGGVPIHKEIDLGYGPARIVSDDTLRNAMQEIDALTRERLIQMALENEVLPDVLMCDVDAQTIEQYHWPYFRSLAEFVRSAIHDGMAVIRY